MTSFFVRFHFLMCAYGINFHRLAYYLFGLPGFIIDFLKFRKHLKKSGENIVIEYMPCLYEKKKSAGSMSGHYFHQDLYIASQVFKKDPQKHLDVGSRIDGFVAHVASFKKIEVADIRPLKETAHNISFIQLDLMSKLNDEYYDYCDSLSCLHAIEHFGLGRYGDEIDAHGHLKGLENLHHLLKRNGTLYISFPIGRERICFNGHRIFNPLKFLKDIDQIYNFLNFSLIDDCGTFYENFDLLTKSDDYFEKYEYSCGIFQLIKI